MQAFDLVRAVVRGVHHDTPPLYTPSLHPLSTPPLYTPACFLNTDRHQRCHWGNHHDQPFKLAPLL